MLNPQKRRRWGDSDAANGGPGGAPVQPHPEPAASVVLTLEDAEAIKDLHLRGAAAQFVVTRQSILQIRRMREAGLIETSQHVRGHTIAKLTARGRQAVLVASRMIAESGPMGRGA